MQPTQAVKLLLSTPCLRPPTSTLAAANVNVAPVKSSTAAGGGSSGGSVHNAGTGGGGNNNSSGNGGDGNTAGQWGSGGGSSGTSTAWGGSSSSGGGGSNGGNSSGDPTPAVHVPANPIVNFVRPEPTMTPRPGPPPGGPGTHRPIVLDLVGNGIKITPLTSSNHWLDAAGDGHQHRTAWAGAGNAVLFLDPNGLNRIAQNNQYIFTEWDLSAKTDLDALRSVFDTNHDGVLNASDAGFSNFKLEVTNPDGSTSIQTLAQAGITSINLTADLTDIVQPTARASRAKPRSRAPTAPPARWPMRRSRQKPPVTS